MIGLFLWIAAANAETIGLRFVVSDSLAQGEAQKRATLLEMDRHIDRLNGYYRNSNVNIRAELVEVSFAAIAAKDVIQILDNMRNERDGFAGMFERAREYGADYTVAVIDGLTLKGKRHCGSAVAVNKTVEAISSTRNAFAAIDYACREQTLAHELGHLMGLNHGFAVDKCEPGHGHSVAIAPYANGYAAGACDGKPGAEKFGDIMVGGWMQAISGNGSNFVPMFSNPRIHDLRCGTKGICGDPEIGDAARALNENAHYYAAHEEPEVHTLRYESAALRTCIGKRYRGKKIAELSELACPGAGVDSGRGIERLTALRRIDLSGNQLQDITALERLPSDRLEKVDLSGNTRIPCSQLDKLSGRYPGRIVRPDSCRRD